MTNKKQILAILAVVFLASSLASAQETPLRTADPAPVNLESRLAERKTRVQANGQIIIGHLTRVAERLESIITRLNSRLAKMEAEGKDLTTAKAKVAEAEKFLLVAKDLLPKLSEEFTQALTATELRGAFRTVRENLQKVRTALHETRLALVEAIRLMKI